jgi:YhcH/YjgK/YiaL family protein
VITDTIKLCRRYTHLSPRFAAALEFLEKLPADKPIGRYEIDGDNCFALIQSYTSRPQTPAQAIFEAHRRYIDIQFLQAGQETILWAPLDALKKVTQPYDSGKDAAFFAAPVPTQMTAIHLRAGDFAIFFPEDGHAPGLECGGPVPVRKVVVKIRV